MPYISPFTGTPRVFRVDLYPIFDGGGNISGFGSYGMDYLDQYSRPGLEALRPQLQGTLIGPVIRLYIPHIAHLLMTPSLSNLCLIPDFHYIKDILYFQMITYALFL